MADPIYKILRPHEWDIARTSDTFAGAPVDLEDGYVHFSSKHQVAETARRYFQDTDTIHVLALSADQLEEGTLKWEASRGGDLFPHLYAPMPMKAVVETWVLDRQNDGTFDFSTITGLAHA